MTSEEKARLLELIDRVEKAQECCAPENAVFDTDGYLDVDATCRECPYKGEECDGEKDPRGRDTLEVFRLARKAAEEEPARLLTVDEVHYLPDKTVICLETYFPSDNITSTNWGIVCNNSDELDGGAIVFMFGRIETGIIQTIPFRASVMDAKTGVPCRAYYRIWTNKPTEEQSKAVKWDD